ncbi:unnamed protein product [Spirodela intermedia]|uniref:Uncharacterized protein n=1 Tax=Spirodela intermedia TaxID=51605 RepID=A0A7I8KQ99_SPIIN|nr:unnamed protein product [Spirodela intermedia]
MPFEGAVRSRVASWLGPWLREQPDAEIKLGFVRCQGTWRDLEFDPLKLDPLIEGSTGLAFKQVRVAELSVRFSPWSRPNLRVSVTGFHVVLVPRELTEESSHVVRYSNAESEDITVDSVDQEDAFLRQVLENALMAAPSGSWLKTSLTEGLLQRCQFQFYDTCFQVQFTGESKLCMLRSREISLEPRLLNETSVHKGTATMFFTSKKEMLNLFSGQTKYSRKGKELWRIAAQRISELSNHPRVSWRKVIGMVLLWSTYVRAYEFFLLLVGYPDENALKHSVMRVCCDLEFASSVQRQLKAVDELEKQLPVEAVGRARWIARKRARLCPGSSLSRSAVLKSFFFSHVRDGIGRFIFLVLGNICIQLSPSLSIPLMENDLELETTPSFRVSQAETGSGSRTVLWIEPVHLLRPPVVSAVNEQSSTDVHGMILENCLRDVQSSWKMVSEEVEGNQMVQPFFLFELRENFINPTSDGAVDGLLRCIAALGKLNIDLDYESTVSFIQLFGQILGSFQWMANASKPHFPPNSFTTTEEMQTNLEGQLQLCDSRLKTTMLKMMPLKNIQVGAMVSGCNVKISFHGFREQDPTYVWSSFSTDLNGIELSVWPASIAKLLEMYPGLGVKAPRGDFLWLKEPQVLDISEGCLDENFIAQGRISHNTYMSFSVAASFENLQDNQKSQAIGPISLNINASTCRHYLHSFYSSDNACSLSLSGTTGKTDVFLYLDELWTLFQVFGDAILTKSRNSVDFDYAIVSSSREYIRRLISERKDAMRGQTAIRSKDNILLLSTQFTINACFESDSVNVILNNSRKNHSTLTRTGGASSSTTLSHGQYLLNLPDVNWGIFLPKSFIQISCEERKLKLLMNFSDIRSAVFKPEYDMDTFNDALMINHFCHRSRPLCEFYLPYIILNLSAGYGEDFLSLTSGNTAAGSTFNSTVPVGGEPFFPVGSKSSLVQSHGSAQRYPSTSISVPQSGFCFMTEIELGKAFLADWTMKNLLADHLCSGLRVLTSSTGELHAIHFESQGGCFFLEMPTLVMFIQTVSAYFLYLTSLQTWATESSIKSNEQDEAIMVLDERVIGPRNHHGQENTRAIRPTLLSTSSKWWFFKFLDLNVSQFSLIFAVSDGSGGVQYLTVEVDLYLRFSSIERNLSLNLLNLNVFSMHLPNNSPSQRLTGYTPFGSRISTELPTDIRHSSTVGLSSSTDIVESLAPISEREITLDGGASRLPPMYHPSYILKDLSASIVVEKTTLNSNVPSLYFTSDWVGSGSVSGFNLTITLSEIQMLMNLIEPLSGISSAKSGKIFKRTVGLQTQGWTNDSNFTVPDGAIVAIQDLHQHLYFAIESVGVTNNVIGTLHYSLVGERALFRVNWHKGKASLFSLTSLHAKEIGGEPLCLNYSPGSGFVEISKRDKGYALWKVVPYKAENYGDDDDVEFSSYCMSSRKAFYLVNHKNNSGVSFVDGFPEFVKNPGSPFKMKVLHELNRVCDAVERNFPRSHIVGPDDSNSQGQGSCDDESRYLEGASLLHISIKIERISITMFHEISDADDKFPLVRCRIGDVDIIGQILPSKFRLICTYFIAMDYFNAKMNSWRQMISPVDSCMFLHSRLTAKDSKDFQKGTPAHYYFRIKQMDISLTELSLDILLFIYGRLSVTGSYTLRSSIFCNCCKQVVGDDIKDHSKVLERY